MRDVIHTEGRISLLKDKLSRETPLPCRIKNVGNLTAIVYQETSDMQELKSYLNMSSLFAEPIQDALYTIARNRYEQETGKVLTKEHAVDGHGNLIMTDIRNILPYKGGAFKQLTNLVGVCRAVTLYQYLKREIRNNYSK